MTEDRDPKYDENGDTEGLSQRQLLLEVRRDVKDHKESSIRHEKEGHGKHPTWPQIITLMIGVVAVFAALTAMAG